MKNIVATALCIARVIALVFSMTAHANSSQPASTSGDITELYGRWMAGGAGGEAIYGIMTIKPESITWKGFSRNEPRCKATYTQVAESDGVTFPTSGVRSYVTTTNPVATKTYLLAIKGVPSCVRDSHWRFTLQPKGTPPIDMDHLEYKKYPDTDYISKGHFFKIN